MATNVDMNTIMENMNKQQNVNNAQIDNVKQAVEGAIAKEAADTLKIPKGFVPIPPTHIEKLDGFIDKLKGEAQVAEKMLEEKEAVSSVLGTEGLPVKEMNQTYTTQPHIAPEVPKVDESINDILRFQTKTSKPITTALTGKESDLDLVLARRKSLLISDTTFVTLPLSKYNARISGLSSAEILNYESYMENATDANAAEYRCRTIYNHIEECSLGKLEYVNFLKLTCEIEIDILFYGLLASTQNLVSTYTFTCNKCKSPIKSDYPNNKLMNIKPEDIEIVRQMMDSINNSINPIELSKTSFANYVPLELKMHCGDTVRFKLCSLFDALFVLRKMEKQNFRDRNVAEKMIYGILPYISEINIPISEVKIVTLTDKDEIFNEIIDTMTLQDSEEMANILNNKLKKLNKIEFGFKDIICEKCGNHIEYIPLPTLDQLLFLKLQETGEQLKKPGDITTNS